MLQILACIHIVPLRQPKYLQLQAPAGVEDLKNYAAAA
jgi:hypothetical protein